MKAPVNPQELFQTLLLSDFSSISCIQENSQVDSLSKQTLKEQLKTEIRVLKQEKFEYLNLLQHKKQLTATLKELLNYRQSIDYDHRYKRLKFEHYQFPYRDNTKIKEDLYKQRLENIEKRKKIKELEQEYKLQEKRMDKKRWDKENLEIWKVGHTKEKERNRDCDEDFWLKRIEKMKNLYLNHDSKWKRAKIKHDYNLMVQKSRCCCPSTKTCSICSDLNTFQTTSPKPQSQGYAIQALLSPRYTSIYRNKKYT